MDPCFDYLNRALDVHTLNPIYLRYSPVFAKGRADKRYDALMERIKALFWPGQI